MPAVPADSAGQCPDGNACVVVTVQGPNPSTQTFSAADLAGLTDTDAQNFQVRSTSGGGTTDLRVPASVSLLGLLAHLDTPVPPEAVSQVYVQNPANPSRHSTPLESDDLGSGRYVGQLRPVVYPLSNNDGGTDLGYIRPLHQGDPGDVNGTNDNLQVSGRPLRITVLTDKRIPQISIVPSTTKADVGQKVSFSVIATDDQTDWTYTWAFTDLPPKRNVTNVTGSWKKPGTKRVTLTVNDPDPNVAPGFAFVDITVKGKAATPPGGATGGGTTDDPDDPAQPSTGGGTAPINPNPSYPGVGIAPLPGVFPSPAPLPGPIGTGQAPLATGEVEVSGLLLVGAEGVPPSFGDSGGTDGGTPATLDSRRGGDLGTLPLLAILLAALLAAGALNELRPWAAARTSTPPREEPLP